MRTKNAGFTLIELLVAVAVFAVMAAMAYGGLSSVIRQRQQNDEYMRRLRQVQQAVSIMTRDFEQLQPRSIRDALQGTRAALLAGPENVPPIEFTRGGWINPLGEARSTQQRVAYTLEDGKLIRFSWPELDQAVEMEPEKQILLPDVEAMDVEFLTGSGSSDFQNQWPPINLGTAAPLLPSGVSIKLTLKDLGDITRIVEVAAK